MLVIGAALSAVALGGIVLILAWPKLPSVDTLADYRPRIPLRVYTADGQMIGEFGEERRDFIRIGQLPESLKFAILAAEDERFYKHGGVDALGILRAALANFTTGGKRQGASTITMQVARNFFLSSEKTLTRKLYEALLAFKIESSLTKNEILEIYINQIYLGQRAYGFSSAARIYFGKAIKDISIAEAAMLAGLPKAPSAYNPIVNPKRARLRQTYVLRRMHALGILDAEQLAQAQEEPLHLRHGLSEFDIPADYVAEMARQIAVERYGEAAYTLGLSVITTLNSGEQKAAYASLQRAVMDYDRRHGYRGIEGIVNLKEIKSDQDDLLEELSLDFADVGTLRAAIVLSADKQAVQAYLQGGEVITIKGEGLSFASRMLDEKASPKTRIRRGAVIRVMPLSKSEEGWQIVQLPTVEAAFVAASPVDGAIRALVGGFDFNRNKFNHVTQAWRQPGSSFKPFIYSAALEKGFSPISILEDEPITFTAEETGSLAWEPKNYDGTYDGPMTLRTALAKSKNMVSIRLLKAITPAYAQTHALRFGFDADRNPPYLTLALGAGAVTPWQQVVGYAAFANGGYRIEPHIISKIQDAAGNTLAETHPVIAGDETLRIIDPRNAWLMNSMMRDVIRRGTATRAYTALGRTDLAGKTGTTNNYVDAWFCGYHPTVVGVAWIGFDQPKRLGDGETGGSAALPIWIGYMEKALAGVPENHTEPPEGLIPVLTPSPDGKKELRDLIYKENLPDPDDEPSELERSLSVVTPL